MRMRTARIRLQRTIVLSRFGGRLGLSDRVRLGHLASRARGVDEERDLQGDEDHEGESEKAQAEGDDRTLALNEVARGIVRFAMRRNDLRARERARDLVAHLLDEAREL